MTFETLAKNVEIILRPRKSIYIFYFDRICSKTFETGKHVISSMSFETLEKYFPISPMTFETLEKYSIFSMTFETLEKMFQSFP